MALLALLSCESPQAPSSDGPATPAVTAPAAPANLSASPGNTEASITWTASKGSASYAVYYTSADPADWTEFTPVTVTTNAAKLTGLTNGTAYQVAVRAVNSAGSSVLSAAVTVTPVDTVPLSPSVIFDSIGSGKASFHWDNVTGATGYLVYVLEPSATVDTAAGTPVSAATLTFEATGLTNGTTYTVLVVATSSGGNSAPSDPVSVTPLAAPAVTAQTKSGQISLSWPAVAGATGYRVYAGTSAGGTSLAQVTNPTYTAAGLSDGVSYSFVVTAVGPSGASPVSAVVTQSPASQIGVSGALEGTWTWSEPRMTGDVSYTATLRLTFTGSGYVSRQTNDSYADSRPAVTTWAKGTFVNRAVDQSVVLTQTDQSTDGAAWTAVPTPLVTVYRNLVVDGRWHPDSWIRVGTGTGLAGSWRTIAEQLVSNDPEFYLVEYELPASGTDVPVLVKGFQVTSDTEVTATASREDTVTWADDQVSFATLGVTFRLTPVKDQWADAGEATAPARVFTRP